MEERNGWQRAIQATRTMDVTVIYVPNVPIVELTRWIPDWVPPNALTFVPVNNGWFFKAIEKHDLAFYLTYRRWHWKAFQVAKELHAKQPFDGSHLVTLCGFREPGYMWKIGVPHIWGPLGGTHNFPMSFSKSIKLTSRWREWLRSKVNTFQLTRSSRIRQAMRRSAAVVAATTGAQADFKMGFGIESDVELETGIDHEIRALRTPRDASKPLRILWAGRLREWKGLPILLHAIATLPKSVAVELRVVGDGSSKTEWTKQASRLGIEHCIEWLPWPKYEETLAYYSWADIFAFTSLRDTSGTGLLESLAAGCPILGLDHQGAKDIMTSDCAIQVAPTCWVSAVAGFRDGIVRMATDPDAWLRLSHGASARAKNYVWGDRPGCIDCKYEQFIAQGVGFKETQQNPAISTQLARELT